jgi:hypothetical protein
VGAKLKRKIFGLNDSEMEFSRGKFSNLQTLHSN